MYRTERSRDSAITQMPASGPRDPVTTPPMSSASISIRGPSPGRLAGADCACGPLSSQGVKSATPRATAKVVEWRVMAVSIGVHNVHERRFDVPHERVGEIGRAHV